MCNVLLSFFFFCVNSSEIDTCVNLRTCQHQDLIIQLAIRYSSGSHHIVCVLFVFPCDVHAFRNIARNTIQGIKSSPVLIRKNWSISWNERLSVLLFLLFAAVSFLTLTICIFVRKGGRYLRFVLEHSSSYIEWQTGRWEWSCKEEGNLLREAQRACGEDTYIPWHCTHMSASWMESERMKERKGVVSKETTTPWETLKRERTWRFTQYTPMVHIHECTMEREERTPSYQTLRQTLTNTALTQQTMIHGMCVRIGEVVALWESERGETAKLDQPQSGLTRYQEWTVRTVQCALSYLPLCQGVSLFSSLDWIVHSIHSSLKIPPAIHQRLSWWPTLIDSR